MTSVLEQKIPAQTDAPRPPAVQANKTYFLPSDEAERARLAMQHALILKGVGGKLVHAPLNFNGESSVLESATGSGI